MIRKTFAWLLVAGLTGAAAQAQTADEIIDKNLQARGGKDKIKAVQSERMTGKMVHGPGHGGAVHHGDGAPEQDAHGVHHPGDDRRPGLRRQDRLVGDAVHGQDRAGGDVRPTRSSRPRSRRTSTARWWTTRRRGTRSSVGKEDVEGTPAYKLKVTKKNGDVVNVYIDAEQYMEIKEAGKTKVRGQEIESETTVRRLQDGRTA